MVYQTGLNMYNYSRYIVGDGSPYVTIQQAINAANAATGGTILIRPGTYTEDLTLYSAVNLEAAAGSELIGSVNIIGVHTPPAAGALSFKRIYFSSATHIFSSVALGSTKISLESCLVNCTNGYTFNLPNWTGSVSVDDVFCSSTLDGFANSTSTASYYVINSSIGAGATPMIISDSAGFYNTAIYCPQTFRTNADILFQGCTICKTQTYLNNAIAESLGTAYLTGASIAITTTSANPVTLSDVTIESSAAPAVITGTGTVQLGSVTYLINSGISGTITKDFTTRLETGTLKINDASVGLLNSTVGVVAGLGLMTDGQLPIGKTGAVPSLATLTAGPGIAIGNAPGAITITNTGAGTAWTPINASQALAPDNGYICIAPGGALVLSLPAVSTTGSEIEILLDGATSFQISQGAGQQIRYGSLQTTLGVGGSVTTTAQGDSIRLVCLTPDLRWIMISGAGNPIIV